MKHIASATIAARGSLFLLMAATAMPATAQAADDSGGKRKRTRVTVGAQVNPRYPGSDDYRLSPFFNLDRATGDEEFTFEAADESTGLMLVDIGKLQLGPAINFQGSRRRRDTDRLLPRVGFTLEAGVAAQYAISPSFRVRGEARQGIGGHKALIGSVSADYIVRDSDEWVFSVGPRLTLASGKYQRAYLGVSPADAQTSGLTAYRPDGGASMAGVSAALLKRVSGPFGVYGFARYDRLIGDAGDSPVVRAFGSRNQLSGGLALSYTFGR